jgi:trehalose/maltose hydrolase-like predicted phosphorylase
MYRFHTLPGARAKAAHFGFKGALYAWESADTGVETTPERVIGADAKPVEILTGQMEHHISADIAYAVWQYWRFTGDDDFFLRAGAEILLDTARFWASRAGAEADGKRHIRHVIGPDEYHADVDDNAFTNVMARWNIALREHWPNQAATLREKLTLRDEELRYVRATAAADLDPDPSTAGGVHIAGLGVLWQAVILGFAGLDLKGGTLGVDPRLPPQWRSLSFRVGWRGRSVAIGIAGNTVQATLVEGEGMDMRIGATTAKLASGAMLQVSI